jgi:hypothetical protein
MIVPCEMADAAAQRLNDFSAADKPPFQSAIDRVSIADFSARGTSPS